jgi:hypothetical protein
VLLVLSGCICWQEQEHKQVCHLLDDDGAASLFMCLLADSRICHQITSNATIGYPDRHLDHGARALRQQVLPPAPPMTRP